MNKIIKIKVLSVIVVFCLSFIIHFAYSIFPNNISAIFFPVNESIWEHMKIIPTSIIIYNIFEFILFKKSNLKLNNFFTNSFITSVIGIVFYLAIYIPIHLNFGHNLFFSLFLLLCTYILTSTVSYFIISKKNNNLVNYLSALLIVFLYILFFYFTYNPIKNFLFYDSSKDLYGINFYTN